MHIPVVVVGAGPVGLTMALAHGNAGIDCVVLTAGVARCEGSRAIALHRSALRVWDELDAAVPIVSQGIAWWLRRTFYREREMHTLELPPNDGFPWWINLPQSALETILITAARQHPRIQLCGHHHVTHCQQTADGVEISALTHSSGLTATYPCRYVVACDGASSTMRKVMGLDFPGHTYPDRFAILDIRAGVDWERQPCMHFGHPSNPASTTLIHPQPDGLWRVDWHLSTPGNPIPLDQRLDILLGGKPYNIVWSSEYRFHQRLLSQLSYGRVLFAGDAAHLVTPFGARGLNSGIQDAAALAPRLASVIRGGFDPAVLRGYDRQRMPSLLRDQEITRATMQFMAPQTPAERVRQRAILTAAARWEFARPWVNSGTMYAP